MPRILAIDYGTKRTGLAVTDPLQIIVNGLETIPTQELLDFLKNYMAKEAVEKIVVGEPMHADGAPAQLAEAVANLAGQLRKLFPDIPVVTHDERFSSVTAKQIILQSGTPKKKRRDKGLTDKISAVLILQDYLNHFTY